MCTVTTVMTSQQRDQCRSLCQSAQVPHQFRVSHWYVLGVEEAARMEQHRATKLTHLIKAWSGWQARDGHHITCKGTSVIAEAPLGR